MEKRIPAGDLVKQKGQLAPDVIAIKTSDTRLGKNGIVDLFTPIPEDTAFSVIRENDKEGLDVIRHSTAHVMADAVQRLFPGTKVTIGPAIEDGFYYDFDKAGGGSFTEEDLAKIEQTMMEVVAKDTPFRREVVSRNDALALFERMGETFKCEIIRSIPEDEEISLYKHGPAGTKEEWVDVCEGPHVPSTGKLRAVKLTSVAGAYWRGDERNPMLQRIYGTAFPTKEALEEHLKLIEEAKARDHRKLGKELDLFFFDPVSPAMPFLLPRGAFVYNRLVQYLRDLYVHYGYEEVITPQAFDPKLFRTSGHLGNYNENMYRLWTEDVIEEALAAKDPTPESVAKALQESSFALKPMNCPSHCVIYGVRKRSYRELPWRVADFGRLHRYERGGVVHGLSRVRTFCQDDAHIFCTREQVPSEIERFLKMFYAIYKAFSLTKIDIRLATRPDKRIGADEDWDMSEKALAEGLERAGLPFTFSPGEGAFYGPKLEFHVQDALKRSWQLGTMQYDPNLPERFELEYTGEDGKAHRPVMLHRAIFGTFERFLSVYLEHIGGNFPTWLAPSQVIVLTVSDKSEAYGRSVLEELKAQGHRAEADFSGDKLGAKIRTARTMRHPYMLVVGPKDAEAGTVSVRARDAGDLGAMPRADFLAKLAAESSPPTE
ncbi:MAG: threonine--tRNA ligase [Labilithrix sp.]|nr:threonine--tRNA ligase [Labilithrix sp.]MCW5818203.1 threonine--tRNA ligase [Labilithrix sp.]